MNMWHAIFQRMLWGSEHALLYGKYMSSDEDSNLEEEDDDMEL